MQALLNVFKGHDFQGAFKNDRKCYELCISVEGYYFKSDGGQQAQS
jgi:hypothetical protein